MFKPKPFKDAEVNPEPPEQDWRDHIELLFSFLWFYRKTFLGLILLTVTGFWIYRVATAPQIVAKSDGESSEKNLDEKYIPSASLKFRTTEAEEPEPEETVLTDLPTLPPSITNPKDGDSAPDLSGTEKALAKLLETGTVDELIEQSLKIHETWGTSIPSVGLVMCAERAKISRRLMAMELSDAQRTYTLTSYIDSISIIDSLNVASKMNIAGTREALAEIDEKYSNHPDPTVYAKAHLAMTSAPLYDFISTGNVERLNQFQSEFSQRIEKIAPDQSSLARLAELTVGMRNKTGLPKEMEPVVWELLDRMNELESPSSKKVALVFRDRLLYDRFQLSSLPAQVEHDDKAIRKTVRDFFATLAEHPDSQLRIYQAAFLVADAFRHFGNETESNRLLDLIDETSDKIPVELNRKTVKEAISKARATRE